MAKQKKKEEDTWIRVRRDIRDRVVRLKLVPSETQEGVIERALDLLEQHQSAIAQFKIVKNKIGILERRGVG